MTPQKEGKELFDELNQRESPTRRTHFDLIESVDGDTGRPGIIWSIEMRMALTRCDGTDEFVLGRLRRANGNSVRHSFCALVVSRR
ncbi:unnamed protein product [Heligmosomoides polygyrus]|uniref:Resolvase/invertase-type recombinase catalytic domain-containing protein n=1 Tax=Heligmosomoides polygyrus TaxID=6339 RepID=A0A183G329_HELPZ|nr:unnamed protein product [Heligmosomoides polygyrus]